MESEIMSIESSSADISDCGVVSETLVQIQLDGPSPGLPQDGGNTHVILPSPALTVPEYVQPCAAPDVIVSVLPSTIP